eukprot:14455572-Alexandrium_andersonii.AAC.1
MGKRGSVALALAPSGGPDYGAVPLPEDSSAKKLPKAVSEARAAFGLSAGARSWWASPRPRCQMHSATTSAKPSGAISA